MAVEASQYNASKIKCLISGLIPGAEVALEKSGYELYVINNHQYREKMEKALQLVSYVDKTNAYLRELIRFCPDWIKERQRCIQEIHDLANNIDFHHRNINIAEVSTSVAGVTSGALTITGLALMPVTFGVSLGLTMAGAIIGIGVAFAGVTNAGTDIGIRIHRTKKAKKCINDHQMATHVIEVTVNYILQNCKDIAVLATDDEIVALAQRIFTRNTAELPRFAALGLTYTAAVSYSAAHTIPGAIKSLNLLQQGYITPALSASSKVTTTALGYTFCSIGMAIDLFMIGVALYDISKGSKTSSAKTLRKIADELSAEMNLVNNMLEILNRSPTKQ